ncbi:MAG TPA: UvrD-helicase domain-containing protein [Vicinamibacterales bacterium]|nr:UvrD-helicase domain-containing protein [Vicinamibacterales bacterium]
MTRRPLADGAERALIAEALEETLIVEAAAGTGKTTELVNRIVRTVERGLARIQEIVAVTFTEKAAGELKLRLREELERARRAVSDVSARDRLTAALAHLEEAHVNTIHGFCGEILRERPVEAHVDPLFVTLDEGQAERLLDEAFDWWLQRQLEDPPPGLRRALRRSPTPGLAWSGDETGAAPIERLRRAARRLAEWREFTSPWERPAYDRERDIDALVARLHALAELTRGPSWDRDRLYADTAEARAVSEAIARAQRNGLADYDGWEARLVDLARKGLGPHRAAGGQYKPGVPRERIVAERDALVEDLKRFRERADADLAALLAAELRGALDRYELLKRREGALDFLDLLLRTRDVLRDHAPVRRTLQERFRRIFVDEFQDTDPVQAEILLLLASADPTEHDWRRVVPEPGKLFLVADPKQSIYRFRRADVAVYYEVRRLLLARGARAVELRTSFRARPEIQAVVNAAFAPEMTGDERVLQAGYVPLAPARSGLDGQPAVVVLPVPRPYGQREVTKKAIGESLPQAVGAFVQWLLEDSGWRVSEPGGTERAIAAGDICILFRQFVRGPDDVTRPYVEALEGRGIPHVLVGGRTFHQREEVESLRAALAAIERPDDELSIFATLRGPLFAVGDEALLEWRQRIGRLHPFAPAVARAEALPPALQPIAGALALLRDLHAGRNHRPVAETIHRLLGATRAHVAFVLRMRGDQVLANVLQVAELARQYDLAGGLSFRGFVEHLAREAERAQAAEAPVIEEGIEGVRLMTVHKAKGLEFPVVVLADLTAPLAHRDPDRHLDAAAGLCALRLEGWTPLPLVRHAELERAREAAEGVRLAYVAATRARDLLVVCAVGDGPQESWLAPLNKAVYPPMARRRDRRAAPGCPPFAHRDSVCVRPDGDPARPDTVCPGLHLFEWIAPAGERTSYGVVWWDPHLIDSQAEPASGIRGPQLVAREADAEVVAAGRAAYEQWRSELADVIERASAPEVRLEPATAWARRESALDLGDETDVEVAEVPLPADRPGGPRFGTLVHALLAVAPLDAGPEALRRLAAVQARLLAAPEEEAEAAVEAARAFLAHPLVRRAADAPSLRRELPVACRLPGGELVEGVVDLVFEEEGRLVVIDFKTDAGPIERARYRRQVQLYAAALRRAWGRPVAPVLLVPAAG